MTLHVPAGRPRTAEQHLAAADSRDATVRCFCGRQIVRGFYLPWVHLTNPGRDHHYARPASRPSVDASSLDAGESGGNRRTPEAPDWAGSLDAPAAVIELPPSVAAVRTEPLVLGLS